MKPTQCAARRSWQHAEKNTDDKWTLLTSIWSFLREFHGQRSLESYSPWGRKGSDMTEQQILSLFLSIVFCYSHLWYQLSFLVIGVNIFSLWLNLLPTGLFLLDITWVLTNKASAAAKSLQLCPTLCDPIDGSPPGSPVPGILQARTLEWVAISFPNAWKWKVKVKSLSCVRLLVTPRTAAYLCVWMCLHGAHLFILWLILILWLLWQITTDKPA